ncbi:hypothetical protein [Sodaliphilus pleomorphus]|uniref:Uncharacterized protein n=1 Tax=Sodaliphilus pleomorphus TaxID=2606626 RepID=A0A6L5XGW0_9BACT|nr:hypothetical protein [Sodaliphilus pleomorphus]MSS18759.1 hypothetical protein [Sodaliphilus pleomorphus]
MSKDYDDDIGNKHEGCASMCIVIVIIFSMVVLLLSLCSCKTQYKVVEVPKVVTQEHTIESVRIDHVRDTLVQRDSIYHYVQGDTVRIERWHYLQGTTNVVRVDTVHVTDSVQVPVVTTQTIEKEVEVPRTLSWAQKTLMIFGGVSMIALLLLIAYKTRMR